MEDNRRGGNGRRDGRREYGSRRDSDRRPSSDRPRRSFTGGSDRPRRSYGEGEERRTYGDRPQRRSYGEASDRPQRRTYGEGGDRPQRRTYGEGGDRPQRRAYGEAGDRPRRPRVGGDRPAGSDRPRRAYGEGSERRTYGDRPQRRSYGDRPQRRTPGRKDYSYFRSEEESGINKMISRRPQLDTEINSDNDMVMAPIKEVVRLNKFIANSGVCSRREADNFILAGVVTVNGEVVTELGTKVNIATDVLDDDFFPMSDLPEASELQEPTADQPESVNVYKLDAESHPAYVVRYKTEVDGEEVVEFGFVFVVNDIKMTETTSQVIIPHPYEEITEDVVNYQTSVTLLYKPFDKNGKWVN